MGCLKGVKDVMELNFIDTRSNKMHTNFFYNMTLLTQNQMYLEHLLFIAAHLCNGMKGTYYFYA
jgi:hypothetical protein